MTPCDHATNTLAVRDVDLEGLNFQRGRPPVSRRTEDWDGPGTAFVIKDAIAYLDSLTLFFWQAPGADLLGALRNAYKRRLIVKAYKVPGRTFDARRRGHRSKRWHVTIHQPQPETLATLSAIHRRFVVHAVHVAIDFLCPDPAQADLATAYLRRGVVQKWRRRNQNQLSHVEANTMYWSRNRKARRNIALYGDRPSKAGLGACSHFEMRFTAAAACKRAGLGDLDSLIRGINAMALLKHQAKLAFIDEKWLDRALEKSARRKLRRTQRRWPASHLAHPDLTDCIHHVLALRDQNIDLPQLRDDLFRLVSLPCHCSPPGCQRHTSSRTTSMGVDHPREIWKCACRVGLHRSCVHERRNVSCYRRGRQEMCCSSRQSVSSAGAR